MKTALSLLIFVFLLSSCSSGPGTATGGQLIEDQSITVNGMTRQYHLFLPDKIDSDTDTVLLLHGFSGSSDQILGLERTKAPFTVWIDLARQAQLILVVPDGAVGSEGEQGWNDCRQDAAANPDTDDVAFITQLLNFIQSRYTSTTANAYAIGISNGGLMTMRLAEEIPEKLSAIAIIVASKPVNSECVDASTPLSVLIMNGTSDPLVPFEGGQIASNRGAVLSTIDTVNYWTRRNQTDLTPIETDIADIDTNDESTIKRYRYENGTDGTVVDYYKVNNGGHTEPSISERYSGLYKLIVGNQNGDLEMAEEVWDFFSTNPAVRR